MANATETSSRRTVTPIVAQNTIVELASLGMATMLWGPPGIGKSSLVRYLATTSVYTTPHNEAVGALAKFVNGKIMRGEKPNDVEKIGHLGFEEQNNVADVLRLYGETRTGRALYDVRLVQQSPIDMKGIPVYDTKNGEATWVMTGAFPTDPGDLIKREEEFVLLVKDLATGSEQDMVKVRTDKRRLADLKRYLTRAVHDQFAVIFLDEMSVAPAMVQAAALQLVLDRQSGMYHIPKNCFVIAAGNRLEDKVGASTLTPTMASRMIHLHLEHNISDWMQLYALPQGVHGLVTGYLKFQPEDFMKFDPTVMGRGGSGAPITFACPRTWDMLSRVLKDCPSFLQRDNNELLTTIAAGIIGDGQAYSFSAFIRIYHELPDPDDVFSGKLKEVKYIDHAPMYLNDGQTRMPEETRRQHALGLMYAFCTTINSRMIDIYKKSVESNRPQDFERAFKNYLDFMLKPEYIEDSPEMAVISTTTLNAIPRRVRSAADERADLMISRINVGGAYAQRAINART